MTFIRLVDGRLITAAPVATQYMLFHISIHLIPPLKIDIFAFHYHLVNSADCIIIGLRGAVPRHVRGRVTHGSKEGATCMLATANCLLRLEGI